MRVHQLLEDFSLNQFKELVKREARKFNLTFADKNSGENVWGTANFWIVPKLTDTTFGLGLSADVYQSMEMTDLIDQDNPAYQKIKGRLSKTPVKTPRWKIVGQCANAILAEAKKQGLTAVEVPHYHQDRYGDVHSRSKVYVTRDIGWDHYPDLDDFDFVNWLQAQADAGADEVDDEFFFKFTRDLRLDYHGYTPDSDD